MDSDARIPRQRGGRFRRRRHRRGRRNAGLPAGRARLLGRRARCRAVLSAARGFRLRRIRADQALLDRRAHRRRRQSASARQQQQRQGGGWLDGAFRDGVAALSAGMVQVAQPARLWRRLAARLAGDVDLLRRGRAGAQDRRPDQLSLGAAAAALSLSGPRAQCRRTRARPGLRGDGDQMDRDAVGDVVGAARARASMRLSRLLRDRLLDQCEAKRPAHLDSARHRGRRRNSRSRHGRQDRGRRGGPGDRRPLSPRRPLAIPTGTQCRGGRLRHRNASSPVELGHRPLPRWSRQLVRTGRQEPDGAIEPGRLGTAGAGGPLLQGAAFARPHRALELPGPRTRISSAAIAT